MLEASNTSCGFFAVGVSGQVGKCRVKSAGRFGLAGNTWLLGRREYRVGLVGSVWSTGSVGLAGVSGRQEKLEFRVGGEMLKGEEKQ